MQIRCSPSSVCAKLPRVETVDWEHWDSALLEAGGGHPCSSRGALLRSSDAVMSNANGVRISDSGHERRWEVTCVNKRVSKS